MKKTAATLLSTVIISVVGISVTVALFVLNLKSAWHNSYVKQTELCDGQLSQILMAYNGGLTAMLGMTKVIDAVGGNVDTISNEYWNSDVDNLLRIPKWIVSDMAYCKYFNNSAQLKIWAEERNVPLFATDPNYQRIPLILNKSEYLIASHVYPESNADIIGWDLLSAIPTKIATEIARITKNLSLTTPLQSIQDIRFVQGVYPHFSNPGIDFLGIVLCNFRGDELLNSSRNVKFLLYLDNLMYFQTPEYSTTNLRAESQGFYGNRTFTLSCGMKFYPPNSTIIVSIFAVILTVQAVAVILVSNWQIQKNRTRHKLIAELASERQKTAEEASVLKSAFLANMSHELRTPINGIIGMTQFLLETHMDSEQQEYAQSVEKSSTVLLSVINDILDFSKIEAGKMIKESLCFDLVQVLHDFEKAYKTSVIAEKKVEFILEHRLPENTFIYTDQDKLQQILHNFISNAVNGTEDGPVVCKVWLIPPLVHFEISDNGPGMTESQLQKLFNPFTKADASRKYARTGLALSVAKKLIELLGGNVSVTSRLGLGTIVHFTIEYIPCQPRLLAPEPTIQKTNGECLKGRIVCVDDNDINRKVASKYIQQLGYKCTLAENGQEAIDLLRNTAAGTFDTILMDIQMPVMDGLTATEEIRRFHPNIPIIAMTANALSSEKERCLQSGMNDFITKPIKKPVLAQILEHYVVAYQNQRTPEM